MNDDRFDELLRGYRLPQVSPALDHRVLSEGAAVLDRTDRTRTRAVLAEVGRSLLHQLGFGYLAWLVDWMTTADAEYRVDFI